MLGNPELERALLEQTYDGVMTVTGTSKQEVGGETVVTPDARLRSGGTGVHPGARRRLFFPGGGVCRARKRDAAPARIVRQRG